MKQWVRKPNHVIKSWWCQHGLHVPGSWKTEVIGDGYVTRKIRRRYCIKCNAMQHEVLETHA